MQRIDTSNAATVMPTPEAVGPNPDGFFTEGNPSGGTPATQVKADWLNAVQEELSYVIEQQSVTLDKEVHTQLKKAIDFMILKGASAAATASGTDTYTATLSPAIAAYTTNMEILIKFTNANTGAATLNLNSLGAKTIKLQNGQDVAAGDIPANHLGKLFYDGTNFQLLNPGFTIHKMNVQRVNVAGAGTYTPTAGMKYVIIQAQAGGGGGGGAATSTAGQIAIGAGGSGGEYMEALYTASQIGASKPYVVGAGGAGGTAGANNGSNGGDTTFNTTWIITDAGNGGLGGAATSSVPVVFSVFTQGGNSGSSAAGIVIKYNAGQYGGAGIALSATQGFSGHGGSSGCGATGGQPVVSSSAVGAQGGTGAGGSGAITANGASKAGANGIDGYISFIEFIG